MRRPLQLARPFPAWDDMGALGRALPHGIDRAAALAVALFAAIVAARPWIPAVEYAWLGVASSLLCTLLTAAMWLRGGAGRNRAAILLGLSMLGFAGGSLIDAIGALRGLPHAAPSWADLPYLLIYPLFAGGVLGLPRRRLPAATMARIALDGVILMLGVLTFSWFCILGPLLLGGGAVGLATVVAAAYPLGDVIVTGCLLLIISPALGVPRPAAWSLAAGMLLVLATNIAFIVQTADGSYVNNGPLDLLWAVAHLISALAVPALRRQVMAGPPAPIRTPGANLRWSLVPYTFLPAVFALVVYARHTHADPFLLGGLTMITGWLIIAVLLRQLLTVTENVRLQRSASEHAARLEGLNGALEGVRTALLARNAELAAANARLEALAATDALTGLPNHRATAAAIDDALTLARERARPTTLLFFDIDHFKAINDTHGHAAGDAVLRELATVARAALREGDYVGRWGGEEFVAILRGTDPAEGPAIAERLRAAVAAHPFGVGAGLRLTCSIGLAATPQDGLTSAEVLHRADLAMYLAKQLGRNRVCVVADGAAEGHGGPAPSRQCVGAD